MNCRDLDGLILQHASGAAIPPEAAAHLAGCERCRRLARVMAESQPATAPSPEQLQQIKKALSADLKPVKPIVPGNAIVLALIFVVVVVAGTGVAALGRAGWVALDATQRSAVFTALAAGSLLLAFSLGRQIVPGSRLMLSPWLLVIAALAVMSGIFATLFQAHNEPGFVATGLVCLRIGLECAIPAGLLFWVVLRQGAILNPVMTAVTTGTLAGLSALTLLEIFCPNLNQYHVLVWHLGAALVSAAGGAAVGRIAEQFSRRRHAQP